MLKAYTHIHIQQLRPLPQYNEYEALIDAMIDGQRLCLHTLIYSPDDWQRFAPGALVPAAIWLERDGAVELAAPGLSPALTQIRDAQYEVVGLVRSVDGEQLILESVLELRVDLDLPPFHATSAPLLRPGDLVRIVGMLKAGLYPE